MELEEARNRAFNKFKKLQNIEILCPALWVKIKFNRDWFYHIVYKNSRHKRWINEQIIRFQCFLDVEEIIKKSHLYQEYAVKTEEIKTRNHGQNKLEKKIVEYFWLVWVIVHNNEKSRVRVVLRKISWKDYAEYRSVIPARNIKWYRNFIWPVN